MTGPSEKRAAGDSADGRAPQSVAGAADVGQARRWRAASACFFRACSFRACFLGPCAGRDRFGAPVVIGEVAGGSLAGRDASIESSIFSSSVLNFADAAACLAGGLFGFILRPRWLAREIIARRRIRRRPSTRSAPRRSHRNAAAAVLFRRGCSVKASALGETCPPGRRPRSGKRREDRLPGRILARPRRFFHRRAAPSAGSSCRALRFLLLLVSPYARLWAARLSHGFFCSAGASAGFAASAGLAAVAGGDGSLRTILAPSRSCVISSLCAFCTT
jgi:hypothetical protein